MKINGKTYNVKTDSKGYASLNVKFAPNTYTITATYKQFSVKNKVVIKSTIVTKNVVKKKAKLHISMLNYSTATERSLNIKKLNLHLKEKPILLKPIQKELLVTN